MIRKVRSLNRGKRGSPERKPRELPEGGDGTNNVRYCRALARKKKHLDVATKRLLLVFPGRGPLQV